MLFSPRRPSKHAIDTANNDDGNGERALSVVDQPRLPLSDDSARFNIGRPIISDEDQRRKSISTTTNTATTTNSSSMLLSPPPPRPAAATDDIYSNLNTYTFGAPSSHHSSHHSFTSLPPPSSVDRTPRPSLAPQHPLSPPVPPPLLDDAASQHTFGTNTRYTSSADHSRSPYTSSDEASTTHSRNSSRFDFTDPDADDASIDPRSRSGARLADLAGSPVLFAHTSLVHPDNQDPDDNLDPSNLDLSTGRLREDSVVTVTAHSIHEHPPSSHSHEHTHPYPPAPAPALDSTESFNMEYIFADLNDPSRRPSYTPSVVQPQPVAASNRSSAWPFRRRLSNSTVSTVTTLGPDGDTFARMINHMDGASREGRDRWRFARERADARLDLASLRTRKSTTSGSVTTAVVGSAANKPSYPGMGPGIQEIWRCYNVGRFKVESSPMDAPSRRLTIMQIADPYSRLSVLGSTQLGPVIIVHKHSRALAFSINRTHHVRRPGSGNANRPGSSTTIMLAPWRVQKSYTNTKTTAKLDTHGLLEDHERSRPRDGGRERERRREHDSERDGQRRTESQIRRREEEREVIEGISTLYPTPRRRPPAPDINTIELANMTPPSITSPLPSSSFRPPPSPSISASTSASTLATSAHTSDNEGLLAPSSSSTASSHTADAEADDDDDDDDDDVRLRQPVRTPHSEAFDTLDAERIAHIRAHAHLHAPRADSPPSLLGWLRRNRNTTPAPVDGPYRPAWLSTASRPAQEESERQRLGMDASFKDVGLLPVNKTGSANSGRKLRLGTSSGSSGRDAQVFENVPEESLYMLLPMWPGHTDPASAQSWDGKAQMSVGEQQYLLVYYMPFEEGPAARGKGKGKDGKDKDKKRRAGSLSSSGGSIRSANTEERGRDILLSSFRIAAQLKGYEELRHSGVRLPADGMAVTGSMDGAMAAVPSASVRTETALPVIIGACWAREKGIEFVPEGLTKLGLCLPLRGSVVCDGEMEEEPVLNALGIAVVEMAWAGSLALTSFGPT